MLQILKKQTLLFFALLAFVLVFKPLQPHASEAGQSHSEIIASLVAKPIFELDPEQIQTIVRSYLSNEPEIYAVRVTETLEDEVLLRLYRDENGQFIVNQDIPQALLSKSRFEAPSSFRSEAVGKVEIYFRKASALDLTAQERNWLANNPTISVGVEEWFPFIRSDSEKGFDGIAADFLNLVLQKTGLEAQPVTGIWSQLLSDFRDGKIDLLPATYFTNERATYGLYSQPYFTGREFLFVKKDNDDIRSFEDLRGKKLAIPEDFGTIPRVLEKFPDIEIVETQSQLESVYFVLDGRADATFEQQIVLEQLLQKELITGIKAVPQTVFDASELFFFSNIDKPLLASILDKALASIGDEEVAPILQRWIGNEPVSLAQTPEDKNDFKLLAIVAGVALGLVVLLWLVRELITRLSGRDVTKAYESREVKGTGLLFVGGFLAIVILAAWITAENAEQEKRATAGIQVSTVLNATHEALRTWVGAESRNIERIASDPYLKQLVKQLLTSDHSPENLSDNGSLALLRKWLAEKTGDYAIEGFFVISPDRISIASERDADLGTINIIQKTRALRMDRVFEGRTKLIPPIASDRLGRSADLIDQSNATMFITTPIYDQNQNIMAALAFRYNPSEDFTRIAQIGRIGESGETYLIDRQATLITNSRFDQDLRAIGLIEPGENAILNLEVRDPGQNLLEAESIPQDLSQFPLTVMAQNAIAKQDGFNTDGYRDYRGVQVVGAWLWNDELGFGITTEIDENEVLATFFRLRLMMAILLSITVVVALTLTGLSVWIGQSANRSLRQARDHLEEEVAERTRELNFQKFALDKHAIVSATDADGKITYVNERFIEVTGFSRNELLGKNHRLLKSGLHTAEFYEDMWSTIASGETWHGELCNRNKDGSRLWLAASIIPFMGCNDTPERYISIRTDITERKRAEQIAQDSEARIKALIQNAVDGIIVINAQGIIQSYSPAAERIFGYREEEVLDKNIKMLMPPSIAVEHNSYLSDYLSGNPHNVVNNNREVTGLRKDGSTFPMDLAVGESIIDGEHIFTGIVRDISERKKAETELENSRKQLHDILANVTQAVVLFDQDKKLVMWNQHYPTTIELDEELLVPGMDLYDIALILASRNQYNDEGEAVEVARQRVDYLWRESNRMDISYGGDRIFDSHNIKTSDGRLIITYSDITQRKKNEEIIASSMKLIQESISYASRIQRSVLPTTAELEADFSDHFLIWEPKDIVGGDICLLRETTSGTLLTLVDCTGHGVPGAFMTMVVTGALDQALIELPDADPAVLLTRINQLVKTILSQSGDNQEGSDDGFECGMCLISPTMGMLLFAGARFELWKHTPSAPDTIEVVRGDKIGIGYCATTFEQSFKLHTLPFTGEDTFYMTSDGLVDQVGGDRRRGFGKKRLKQAILETSSLDLGAQKKHVLETFASYQGTEDRRDDLSMIAFKLGNTMQMDFNI